VHVPRQDVDVVEQRAARACLVPLRVPGRQETLVAPPDLDPAPVDRVPGGGCGEFGEHLRSDAAAGQHDRSQALRADRVDQPGNQPGRDRLGEQPAVVVDQDLRGSDGLLLVRRV
jgi:hypothetical protein